MGFNSAFKELKSIFEMLQLSLYLNDMIVEYFL